MSQTEKRDSGFSILCFVCVPRFQLTHLLRALRKSARNQLVRGDVNMEIGLADYNENRAAEPVIQKLENKSFDEFELPLK